MITPCTKCHKRHGRDEDHGSPAGGVSKQPLAKKSSRALVLIASLLAGSAAASSPAAVSVSVGTLGMTGGVGLKGGRAPLM